MTERKDSQDPSMEEILSSIRRIIADGQEEPARASPEPPRAAGGPQPVRPAAGRGPAPAPEEDELELTEIVAEPAARVPSPAPTVSARASQPPERASMPLPEDPPLVSPTAAEASTSALARLARAVAPEARSVPAGGRTVEELVLELLRPQLKEWLDQNLPALVERVVEQEVKKLARRAELL